MKIVWEGKKLRPQYPNSVMYALNADLDMFEFMKTLLMSDNKVINIVIQILHSLVMIEHGSFVILWFIFKLLL